MAERKIKNLTSDYLTCTVCFNVYVEPKLLPCGHTFCAKCLEGYIRVVIKQRDCFECPMCRDVNEITTDTDVKTFVTSLSNDTVTLSILRALGVKIDSDDDEGHRDFGTYFTERHDTDHSLKADVDDDVNTCARHRERKLDVYCATHEVIVCSECAKDNHSQSECKCTVAKYVINKRIVALKSLVAQQASDASRLFDAKDPNVKSVRSLFDEVQKAVSEVEQTFDDLNRQFKQRIESVRTKAKETIEHDEASMKVRRLQDDLVSRVKTLDAERNATNPNEVLQSIATLCRESSNFQKNLTVLAQKVESGSLLLHVENDINLLDVFVSGVKSSMPEEFQTFEETNQNDPTDAEFVMVTTNGTCDDFHELDNYANNEVQQHTMFNAKMDDEKPCLLSSVAMIGTTGVVIVDQANKRLKKFKIPDGALLTHIDLKDEPHQVASLRDSSQVAVSLWEVGKILIITTDPLLAILKTINTETEYIGLTSHVADCLAASSIQSRRVDVFDTRVTQEKTLQKQTIYQSCRKRSFPDRLTSTNDGKIIIRNRRRNEIICFGHNRNLLWSRRLKRQIADITCLRNRVFASFRDRNEIVYFRADGQGELETLALREYIRHPWAMDGFKDCLVVTEDGPSATVHLILFK